MAGDLTTEVAELRRRLDRVEDINAIRKLHNAYGYYIDYNRAEDVAKLFTENGEVIFLGGIYRGHDSIFRLYGTWFRNYFVEGNVGPVNGFLLDHFQMQDIVTVSDDGTTAKGRFRAVMFAGSHQSRSYRPEGMPDQVMEAGIYENDYVKEDGIWKLQRLDYVLQWQAEYEKGWSKSDSVLRPAVKTFPDDPFGPDELLDETRPAWPERKAVEMHFHHPVTGES